MSEKIERQEAGKKHTWLEVTRKWEPLEGTKELRRSRKRYVESQRSLPRRDFARLPASGAKRGRAEGQVIVGP